MDLIFNGYKVTLPEDFLKGTNIEGLYKHKKDTLNINLGVDIDRKSLQSLLERMYLQERKPETKLKNIKNYQRDVIVADYLGFKKYIIALVDNAIRLKNPIAWDLFLYLDSDTIEKKLSKTYWWPFERENSLSLTDPMKRLHSRVYGESVQIVIKFLRVFSTSDTPEYYYKALYGYVKNNYYEQYYTKGIRAPVSQFIKFMFLNADCSYFDGVDTSFAGIMTDFYRVSKNLDVKNKKYIVEKIAESLENVEGIIKIHYDMDKIFILDPKNVDVDNFPLFFDSVETPMYKYDYAGDVYEAVLPDDIKQVLEL